MWTWDAEAPGRSGGGASDDRDRVRKAAEHWRRTHPVSTARMQQMVLAMGAGLGTQYKPAEQRLVSRLHQDGRITWARLSRRTA